MILLHLKLTSFPDKRRELLQTLREISKLTRKEKACLEHHFSQGIEDQSTFSLIEKWPTREDVDMRLRSHTFAVLIGAITLLSKKTEMTVSTVLPPEEFGADTIFETMEETS